MRRADAEETLARAAANILDSLSDEGTIQTSQSDKARQDAPPLTEAEAFVGDPQIDRLISSVKLADWDAAEEAALLFAAETSSSGKNEKFETLLRYQDCSDDDDRFRGALQTIECCAHLAPLLLNHDPESEVGLRFFPRYRAKATTVPRNRWTLRSIVARS